MIIRIREIIKILNPNQNKLKYKLSLRDLTTSPSKIIKTPNTANTFKILLGCSKNIISFIFL